MKLAKILEPRSKTSKVYVTVTWNKEVKIWVFGNTYPIREKLKEYSFKWESREKAWVKVVRSVEELVEALRQVKTIADEYVVNTSVCVEPGQMHRFSEDELKECLVENLTIAVATLAEPNATVRDLKKYMPTAEEIAKIILE